jgi:phytoene synthase
MQLVASQVADADVAAAYQVCRNIARERARNFYYSFVALPPPKRDAICAVYAFMRHADDLSDDESLPLHERRVMLDSWLTSWRAAMNGGLTNDPVFLALRHAQQRFAIPSRLLEELVEGTTMDVRDDGPQLNRFDTYATFTDLYRYCYLVASVVGLVCIRIFGYDDPQAERLAEETGIAFQLTNILRDVREDAERKRIYLPCEDLQKFNVSVDQLQRTSTTTPEIRKLLEFEAQRAQEFYRSGQRLLPLIAADSRPALWVLITIYHRLLQRIENSGYDVFSSRVSVPTYEKLAILGWGILRGLKQRLASRA